MQRKQQVGECWVCVIFFACVCVGALDTTTASYHLRMEDGDSVTEHLNAFNTLVSQLGSVNITIAEEDKCITLLCSLPDSWDNLVVAIGSTTQPTLKYKDVVASLLSEEMRRKSMDGHSNKCFICKRASPRFIERFIEKFCEHRKVLLV
jgi:hypothetical protein